LLEEAEFVVFDLETTGLSAAHDHICALGAVRVRGLEPVDSFQSLVNPRVALPLPVARLTGVREHELRRAPSVSKVVGRFLSFAGEALLVAHNARFDQRFLERQLLLLQGRRLSEPPLCTAALARHLLAGRRRRAGLASLAEFFGVPTSPCHRALPDAEATAQVLITGGEVSGVHSIPPRAGAGTELEARLALCRTTRERAGEALSPEQAEDMLLLYGFARRPPPELCVLPLDIECIRAHLAGVR